MEPRPPTPPFIPDQDLFDNLDIEEQEEEQVIISPKVQEPVEEVAASENDDGFDDLDIQEDGEEAIEEVVAQTVPADPTRPEEQQEPAALDDDLDDALDIDEDLSEAGLSIQEEPVDIPPADDLGQKRPPSPLADDSGAIQPSRKKQSRQEAFMERQDVHRTRTQDIRITLLAALLLDLPFDRDTSSDIVEQYCGGGDKIDVSEVEIRAKKFKRRGAKRGGALAMCEDEISRFFTSANWLDVFFDDGGLDILARFVNVNGSDRGVNGFEPGVPPHRPQISLAKAWIRILSCIPTHVLGVDLLKASRVGYWLGYLSKHPLNDVGTRSQASALIDRWNLEILIPYQRTEVHGGVAAAGDDGTTNTKMLKDTVKRRDRIGSTNIRKSFEAVSAGLSTRVLTQEDRIRAMRRLAAQSTTLVYTQNVASDYKAPTRKSKRRRR